MTGGFDPELIELTIAYRHGEVGVYKIGDGTLGRSYDGLLGICCDDERCFERI